MLTKRETEIFLQFCEHKNEYLKANHFSDELNVSLRTVQNDIKVIKKAMQNQTSFEIESKVPFGTRLIVKDQKGFEEYLASLKNKNDESLGEKEGRIHKLLNYLLNQRKSIPLAQCADYIYVSKSTLINDLKDVEKVLNKFSLKLLQSVGYVWVDGLERDCRMCLIDNLNYNLNMIPSDPVSDMDGNRLERIRKIIMEEFLHDQYPISDVEFQNIIIWVNISVVRIKSFFYLNEEDIDNQSDLDLELKIANEIYTRIEKHFHIRVPQTEINFLALYISNHSNVNNIHYISDEINDFIFDTLEQIHQVYPADFTHDMNLRMSLALHCEPLISRARNNIQIKNEMLNYIKQSFPYAFEIATYFSYLLSEKFECKIKESETAFLAIYFNKSLNEQENYNGGKKICIITNLQRSQYFLLEQFLYDKFKKYISAIQFVNTHQLETLDLDNYDLFFSTEDNRATEVGLATKINFFPNEKELEKIKVRIEGFKNIDDVLCLFDSRLFAIKDFNNKKQIQDWLVNKAASLYKVKNLSEEIELREEFGSTYFGNKIAILHPMHANLDDSFIGEILLKKPIVWDNEGNHVQVVFLLCIEKSNLEAFRAWDFLSPALFNPDFIKQISYVNNFDEFKALCENKLKSQIISKS